MIEDAVLPVLGNDCEVLTAQLGALSHKTAEIGLAAYFVGTDAA